MANEVLNAEEAQLVVDGLLLGYKEYLDIRKEMKEKLKVSAGFAFTKGNFIDDGVARKLLILQKINAKKQAKVGNI